MKLSWIPSWKQWRKRFHFDHLMVQKERGVAVFMMTSSNGNIFRATGLLCGASGEFLAQRPVTRSFDAWFDLCLNKLLRKQSWGWWFETLWRPLWRHCNVAICSTQVDLRNAFCIRRPHIPKCLRLAEMSIWAQKHNQSKANFSFLKSTWLIVNLTPGSKI